MYPHQAERLGEALAASGSAALVATAPENVRYVTGFRSLTATVFATPHLAVVSPRGTALVVPAIDVAPLVADGVSVDHVVCFGGFRSQRPAAPTDEARRVHELMDRRARSPADALAAALDALGAADGTIGVDESRLTPAAWQRLAERLAPRGLAPAAERFGAARRVKGPHEIECLHRALGIAEEALDAVVQTLGRGVTEQEAMARFEAEVVRRGATPRAGAIAFGAGAAIPAPWPTERALAPGDLARFDVGCAFRGYHASVARTAVLGQPDRRQDTLYGAMLAGVEAALEAIAPGVTAGRVFDAALAAARAAGAPGYERSHVGHGIGLEPYERPKLAAGDPTPLEAGEVLRVEMPWHEHGVAGLGLTETVLVTRAGARVLNRSARGLVVLD